MTRTDDRDQTGVDRLERAIVAYIAWQDSGQADRDGLLERHADLRDLLEPMLDEYDSPSTPPMRQVGNPVTVEPDCTLGEFRLVREIGRGGMGVVYEARQTSLNRRVAVKVLPALAALHPRSVARFRREAAVIARMSHPGIVDVVAVGQERDTWYLAMELVFGVSLDRLVRQFRGARDPADIAAADVIQLLATAAQVPASETSSTSRRAAAWNRGYVDVVIEVTAQVAEALQHAHDQGVIHRDVKPSNIMIRTDGRAVLMDFGLARDDSLPTMTASGEFAGTPYYVSPEQALAHSRDLDHRTDVFSLGATLYELVTLRRPFDADSDHELLDVIIRDEPVDPSRCTRAVSYDLAAVILKALEKEPGRRYQSAGAMAADLRALLEYRPVVARHASTWQRLRRWVRREPMRAALYVALAAGVPAVAGLTGYLLARLPDIRLGQEQARREQLNGLMDRAAMLDLMNESAGRLSVLEDAYQRFPEEAEVVGALATALEYRALGLAPDDSRRREIAERLDRLLASHEQLVSSSPVLREIQAFAFIQLGEQARADALMADPPPLRNTHDLLLVARRVLATDPERAGAERARSLLENAMVHSDQPSARILFALAMAAERLQDRLLGRHVADGIDERFPGSRAAGAYAAIALMADDPAVARERFEALAQDADEELRSWIDYHVALSFRREGRDDEAMQYVDRALERCPGDANLLIQAGRLRRDSGDHEAGLEFFRRAISESPNLVTPREVMIATLSSMRRWKEVLDEGERALSVVPNSFEIRSNMAIAAMQLRRMDEALEYIRGARGLARGQAFLAINEANIRLARGELDQVESIARELIEGDSRAWQPWMLLAEVAARRSDLDEAARCYRAALRIEPNRVQLVRNLGRMLERAGRLDLVRAELERFAGDHPSQTWGWAELTRFLLRTAADEGAVADALRYAKRAVSVNGRRDPEVLWLLGQAHLRCGQREQAEATVEEAMARIDAQLAEAATDQARALVERKRDALQTAVRKLGL